MKLIEIIDKQFIVEADIPETEWGYWIDDNGAFLAVSPGKVHSDIVKKHFKIDDEGEAHDEAYKRGWVRIAFNTHYPKNLNLEIVDNVAPKAKQSLVRLIREYKRELREINVDISKEKVYKRKKYKAPYGVGKAINFIINSF